MKVGAVAPAIELQGDEELRKHSASRPRAAFNTHVDSFCFLCSQTWGETTHAGGHLSQWDLLLSVQCKSNYFAWDARIFHFEFVFYFIFFQFISDGERQVHLIARVQERDKGAYVQVTWLIIPVVLKIHESSIECRQQFINSEIERKTQVYLSRTSSLVIVRPGTLKTFNTLSLSLPSLITWLLLETLM